MREGLHVLSHGEPSSLLGAAIPSSMVALEAPTLLPKPLTRCSAAQQTHWFPRGEVWWK